MTPERARLWQILLLLPQPPLSLLYLALVRAEHVRPSFLPVVALTLLPLAALLLAPRARRGTWAALAATAAIAVLELAWGLASAALVGFAIAAQSG